MLLAYLLRRTRPYINNSSTKYVLCKIIIIIANIKYYLQTTQNCQNCDD